MRMGGSWRENLTRALESSDAVISLITENSVTASYPMSEIGAARAWKKTLIPVVVDVDIPDVVDDIFCITASSDDTRTRAGMKRIVEEIARRAGLPNKTVFIVHGHNEAKKYELKSFLADLGLTPMILHEQDDRGMAIIEKFEQYAPSANFAFVLLTPDDKPPDHTRDGGKTVEAKWRARQNVIMELGWFMARLGRSRVVMLHKGEVEIPSDISGVLYLKFNDSILEVSEQIRRRLRSERLIT